MKHAEEGFVISLPLEAPVDAVGETKAAKRRAKGWMPLSCACPPDRSHSTSTPEALRC